MKIILAFLSIFIISVDQLIKFFVSEMIDAQDIFIFPEILKLKIHQNTGIAFGLPFNPWLAYFLIILLGILFLIISVIAKSKATKSTCGESTKDGQSRNNNRIARLQCCSNCGQTAFYFTSFRFARNDFQKVRNFFKENFLSLIFIFSGALSNLLDRIRFGYVIDYIELVPLKGTFNLADCAIVLGTGIIIWRILKINYKNFLVFKFKLWL